MTPRAMTQLVRTSFINMLAYRLNYYTGIVTYTVHIAVNSSVLAAVHAGRPEVFGFNLRELVTFTALGYMLRSMTFNNLDQHIANQVHDGSMVIDLIKPVDYHLMQMSRGTGEALFRLFCFSLPIILVNGYLFDINAPRAHPFVMAFSVACAFWIFAQITFIIGLCAVYMTSISGLLRLKNLSLNLLMGLLIPLTVFPDWLRETLTWTPLPQVSWVPVCIAMGRHDLLPTGSLQTTVLLQLGWAIAMTLLARLTWMRVKHHVTVQGG